MSRHPPAVRLFYASGKADIPVYSASKGTVTQHFIQLQRSNSVDSWPAFSDRLHEIDETRRVRTSGEYQFEIAEVNRGVGKPATIHISTYNSSISRNPGNVAELAMESNGRYVVYVSSIGQGATSTLSPLERKRFSTTGSLIWNENGVVEPAPIVYALADILDREVSPVSALRADSSGRVLTAALARVLPIDSVSTLYQNAPPNFGGRSALSTVARLVYDDLISSRRRLKKSLDLGRIDKELQQLIRHEIPFLFESEETSRISHPLIMAIPNLRGLTRPAPSPLQSVAIRDLSAGLSIQSKAICGLVFGGYDPLFAGITSDEIQEALVQLSAQVEATIRCAIIAEGRHNSHSAYPDFYRVLETALTRV